jgi:hypothetical protein
MEKYFPKFDLLTKELIIFKSEEQYEMADFTDKRHLKKYLEINSKEIGLEYCKNWLIRRKNQKSLIYSPGQFELKSLCFPNILSFHKLFGAQSYEKLCSEIGLINKYKYNLEISYGSKIEEIIVDTRESKPWKLDLPVKIEKLDFADYCPIPNPQNIFIERKEITDWAGVMSNSYERFEREIQRAKDANSYIIIIIESKYSDLLAINYLPHTKFIKAKSEFLMKRMRDLYLKFDNFQMVAAGTRSESIKLFNKIITLNFIKEIDIQYYIENKQIN